MDSCECFGPGYTCDTVDQVGSDFEEMILLMRRTRKEKVTRCVLLSRKATNVLHRTFIKYHNLSAVKHFISDQKN